MNQIGKKMIVTALVALMGASAVLADVKVRLRSSNDFIVEDRGNSAALLTITSGASGKAVLGTGNGPAIVDANQVPTKKYVDDRVAANKAFASYAYGESWEELTTGEEITFSETKSAGSDLTLSTHTDGHHMITVNTAGDYYVSLKSNRGNSANTDTTENRCQNDLRVNGTQDFSVYSRTGSHAWANGSDSAVMTFSSGDVLTVTAATEEYRTHCSTYSSLPAARLMVRKM